MDTSAPTDNGSFAVLEKELNNFVQQTSSPIMAPQIENNLVRQATSPTIVPQIEDNAERIRSSVARLTSDSIEKLEGLNSELQKLQEFLSSEVERVQREIESTLAGINIIIETITPWKKTMVPVTPPNMAHPVRGPSGPAPERDDRGKQRL